MKDLIRRRLAAMGINAEGISDEALARMTPEQISKLAQQNAPAPDQGPSLLGQRPDTESQGRPQMSQMPEDQAPAAATAEVPGEAPQTPRTEAPGTWETAMMSVAKVAPELIKAANQKRPNAPAFGGGGNKTLDIPTAASIYGKKKEDPFLAKLAMMLRGAR